MFNLDIIKHVVNGVCEFVKDHASTIQTVGIVAGAVAITACAIVDTKNAIEKAEERKEELEVDELDTTELIKTAAPCYIRTGLALAGTVAMVIIKDRYHASECAAAAANCAMYKNAANKYRQHLAEKSDEESLRKADREVVEDMNKSEIKKADDKAYHGKDLIKDWWTGKIFWTTRDKVETALATIAVRIANCTCIHSNSATISDFYSEIDANYEECPMFDDAGWNVAHIPTISWDSGMTDDGHSCLIFKYNVFPKHRYLYDG